jgi:general secretion pathway protein D
MPVKTDPDPFSAGSKKERFIMKKFFVQSRGKAADYVLNISVFVIIAGLSIGVQGPPFCFGQELEGAAGNLISMDFQDVALEQILKIFSQQSGINFVASENIKDKKVTLFLDKVTMEDALNTVLGANGLTFEKQPNTNIYMVKESGLPSIVLNTKIYKLNYAAVTGANVGDQQQSGGIESILQQVLTANGKLMVDARTNSVLITDVPDNFVNIENVLKELDIKTSQVMISAEILEVAVDTLKRLGIEWGSDTGQFMTFTGGSRSSYWPFKESLFKGATESATAGTVSFSTFTAVLKAIKTDSGTQYLARPRLLTLNNTTAEMKITKDAAVSTSAVQTAGEGLTQATTSLERYEVGTILKITPHINKDDYITMTIEPEVSRVKVSTWNSNYFDPFKRTAKTTIMVKDGETIVIAGLISREDSDSNRRVPFLGEVPIFGKIFNRNENQRSDTEIFILVTPHIIREEGQAFATAMKEELGFSDQELVRRNMKRFHHLTREQDSQLSGKELIMDAEVLKLQTPNIIEK